MAFSGKNIALIGCLGVAGAAVSSCRTEGPRQLRVGAARVEITPEYPVRLAGYAARRTECTGVEQRLWARALAIGEDPEGPALLITVENCVLPGGLTEAICRRLNRTGIPRERVVIACTHTHSAPCLSGALPTMFGEPLPPDHQARIERYTQELTVKLEQAALSALADRRPARLGWAQGQVTFAVNRRTFEGGRYRGLGVNRDGPTDHALPVLRVTDPEGRLVAVAANYACHCTALGADYTKVCGDWAGYAAEAIENEYPGSTCLVMIGCGADADPQPRTGIEYARRHGRAVAAEIRRLLDRDFRPLSGPPMCRLEFIRLPFGSARTRQQWAERARRDDAVGYQARLQLARLDRGEPVQTHLDYPVQTWVFGDDLAMIFLGGEVVVDYALRLKREYDPQRLWVTAYANDVPCYIPSQRVLAEGGYEAEESMVYYDRPGRLAPEVEDLIMAAVGRLVPPSFRAIDTAAAGGLR